MSLSLRNVSSTTHVDGRQEVDGVLESRNADILVENVTKSWHNGSRAVDGASLKAYRGQVCAR